MRRILILLYLETAIGSFFVIQRVNVDFNPRFVFVNVSFMNNKASHTNLINSTFETFDSLEALNFYVKISIPENEEDRQYRRDVLRTVVRIEKAVKGAYSNGLIGTLMDSLLKSATFDLRLPLAKGVYSFVNMTLTDKYVPPIFGNSIFRTNLRFVGKMGRNNTTVHIGNIEAFTIYYR